MLRSALGNRRTSRRLMEHHRITTTRRRCIRRQNFNSSGPLANFRNGEQFLRKIDRPRRHGGGSPRSDVVAQHEEMGALLCYRLQLPVGSTYAAGAAVVMRTLADQTSLPWPDEFPRKIKRESA
jgi:hypothetical protein